MLNTTLGHSFQSEVFAPNLLPSEEDPGWFSIEEELSMEKAKHVASAGPLENDVNPKAPESKEVPKNQTPEISFGKLHT